MRRVRSSSILARACAALVATATTLAALPTSRARADEEPPEGSKRGRIPVWSVGLAGGVALRPFGYHIASDIGGVPPSDGTSSRLNGIFGPTASLDVDLDDVVLVGAGTLSLPSPTMFEASFGAVMGIRHWTQYTEVVASDYVAPDVVEVTVQPYDVYFPTVYGLYVGGGVYSMGSATGTGIDSFGYDTQVPVRSGTIPTVEAGAGMAGRMGLIAAAAFDPTRGTWGGRFRSRFVFGTGSTGLYWGANVFVMSGSATNDLPVTHVTIDFGYGDGPGIF